MGPKGIFKNYYPAAVVLAAALAAGSLQLLPTVFLERAVHSSGREFLITQMTHHGDAALYYLPRAREIMDGHFPVIDLHAPENRSGLFLWPPGPQLLFAGFLRLADNENHAYMAAGFTMTAAMFLAFYWLGQNLWAHRLGSLLFAGFGVLSAAALHLPRAFFSPGLFSDIILKNFVPLVRTPLPQLFLGRIEHPLLTLWLHILVFTLLWRLFAKPSHARALAFGLAAGMQIYFYLHFWLYTMILFGLLWSYNFIRGRPLKPWLIAAVIIGTIILPYLVNFVLLGRLEQWPELWRRIGVEYGWGIRLSVWRDYLAYLGFGLAALVLLRRSQPLMFVFAVALLAAMVIGLNLQFFLGWNPQPDHWLKVFSLPLYALAGALAAAAVRRWGSLFKPALGRALALVVLISLLGLMVSKKIVNAAFFVEPGEKWVSEYSFPGPLLSSWRWINGNMPPESVLISNSLITSLYLSGYTSADPYLPFAENTIMSNRAVEERFLTAHKLFGTTPQRLAWLLTYRKNPFAACRTECDQHTAMNLSKAPAFLYGQTNNPELHIFDMLAKESGVSEYALPPHRRRDLLLRYRALGARWSDFSGAYVFVGPWERELNAPDFRSETGLQLLYDREGIEIYRVR